MFARNCHFQQGVSCFVLGPRGTGKTYWLHQLYPGAVFIDLLEARTFNLLAADPQRLGNLIGAAPKGLPIIIDEIQKLPSLLDEVHRLIEISHPWFIMTGSSARKLRQAGVNLLGGRAITKQFHPLTAVELGEAFDLEKALKYGLLPSLYDNGMKAFASEYPEARKIILYGGDHEEMLDGIQLIPLAKAFPTLENIVWPNQAKPVSATA